MPYAWQYLYFLPCFSQPSRTSGQNDPDQEQISETQLLVFAQVIWRTSITINPRRILSLANTHSSYFICSVLLFVLSLPGYHGLLLLAWTKCLFPMPCPPHASLSRFRFCTRRNRFPLRYQFNTRHTTDDGTRAGDSKIKYRETTQILAVWDWGTARIMK
jgi:hypothetical protein